MKLFYPLFISLLLFATPFSFAKEENGSSFTKAKNKLEALVSANNAFVASNNRSNFEPYLETQTPALTIVMCSDSRVQPPSLHDNPAGKLFTIRNIGNQLPVNEGSIDYGVLVLKTPLLLILGHTGCGAVNAVFTGNTDVPKSIKKELRFIRVGNAKDSKEALINNVDYQIKVALKKYKNLIAKKQLFIVGAIYDIHNLFGYGCGSLVFTNINGATNPTDIKIHPLFENIKNLKIVH